MTEPEHVRIAGVRAVARARAAGGEIRRISLVSEDTHAMGFVVALGRLEATLAKENNTFADVYMPLFETLNWAVVFQTRTGESLDHYLNGLRFVRNRVHHQWAQAIDPESVEPPPPKGTGIHSTSNFGATQVRRWLWRDIRDLPDPDPGREDPDGLSDYKHHLAKRPIVEALRLAKAKIDGQ